jgi:hypothetical protein
MVIWVWFSGLLHRVVFLLWTNILEEHNVSIFSPQLKHYYTA